jgi:TolA-binding protein
MRRLMTQSLSIRSVSVGVAAATLFACAGLPLMAPSAQAQSVTAPSQVDPVLLDLRSRIDELEREVQRATDEKERAQRELALARAENARLNRLVEQLTLEQDAARLSVQQQPPPQAAPPPPPPPAPTKAAPTPPAPPAAAPLAPPANMTNAGDPDAVLADGDMRLRRSDFLGAEEAYRYFLAAFPGHQRASHAKFWLGQSLLYRRQNDEAAIEFVDLLRTFPNATLAPNAKGWLAVALARGGRKQQACTALSQARADRQAWSSIEGTVMREQLDKGCPR